MADGAMHDDLVALGRNLAVQNASNARNTVMFPNTNFNAPDPFSGVIPDDYTRFYGTELMAARTQAAGVFAARAKEESLRRFAGDVIGDAAFAVGGVIGGALAGGGTGGVATVAGFMGGGLGASLVTEQVLKATGFFNFDPLVSLDEQSRAMVDSSIHRFAFGAGGSGIDRGISFDEARDIGSDSFQQFRDRGFHGVEASRVADVLSQYGDKLHMGSGSENIANQLEEYFEGVMDVVKRTNDTMERASQMVAEAKLMGVSPDNAGNFYGGIADFSSIAGVSPNEMLSAGQQHAAPFASTGFGVGGIVTSFSRTMAESGLMSGNSSNARLWNAAGDAPGFGMHQAQLGSAFVANPSMWGKLMGGGTFDHESWSAMMSGQARPDTYGDAYNDLNANDRLVAQYRGVQEIMARPDDWTRAATGSLFGQMSTDNITNPQAQAMWLYQNQYSPDLATARLDVAAHNLRNSSDYETGMIGAIASGQASQMHMGMQTDIVNSLAMMGSVNSIYGDTRARPWSASGPITPFVEGIYSDGDSYATAPGTMERVAESAGISRGFSGWSGITAGVPVSDVTSSFDIMAALVDEHGSFNVPLDVLQMEAANASPELRPVYEMLLGGGRSTTTRGGFDTSPNASSNYTRGISESVQTMLSGDGFWGNIAAFGSGTLEAAGHMLDYGAEGIGRIQSTVGQMDPVIAAGIGNLLAPFGGGAVTGAVMSLYTSSTESVEISAEMIERLQAGNDAYMANFGDPTLYAANYGSPTTALAMRARETGWYGRNITEDSRRFGAQFNSHLEEISIRSSLLDSDEVDANLNMWQDPGGWDPGWQGFLDTVSDNRAAYIDTGNISEDYNNFAMAVYGSTTNQLTSVQSRNINTYLGAGGSGPSNSTGNLLTSLSILSARPSEEDYDAIIGRVTTATGLTDREQISDIAKYGIYRSRSAQLTSEIREATNSEDRARLQADKDVYDSEMRIMVEQEPMTQRWHNEYYTATMGAIGDNQDDAIRVAGGDRLDEQMARGEDIFNRASEHASDLTNGLTLEQLQGMTLTQRQAALSGDLSAYGPELEAVLKGFTTEGGSPDLSELLDLQNIADLNPDNDSGENGGETPAVVGTGGSELTALWVQGTELFYQSISRAVKGQTVVENVVEGANSLGDLFSTYVGGRE